MVQSNELDIEIPELNEKQIEKDCILCTICGSNHNNVNCSYVLITNHVLNKKLPSKARLSLPDDLIIERLSDGTNQVKTKKFIQKGTQFGPFEAAKSLTLNPSIQFPVKVFPYSEEEFLEYYLDTSTEEDCTWMMFVQPASHYEEQNLTCFQDQDNIYYVTIRDLNEDECLKVWYAPYYAKKMEKNILMKECKNNETCHEVVTDVNKLVKSQQEILDRESWTCKFCGAIKVEVTIFANHIIEHYMTQLRKTCEICKATFNSRKSLRKHMIICHNPINKKIKSVLSESPRISAQKYTHKELSIGGPLLNSLELIDNFDNSNLLMPTLAQLDESLQDMSTENLNLDNLLTENVRGLDHFNFEIGECQEEFVCDICVKSFSKLRYLIQHLKRHTGEYACSICKKVLCRKESLTHHLCTKSPNYKCEPCGRTFLQKKYYNRHVESVHKKKFKCDSCNNNYCSKYELSQHNCKNIQGDQNKNHHCTFCNESFLRPRCLKKHILRHHTQHKAKIFVCEICGKQYQHKHSHDLHLKTHGEPEFQCDICDKKFFRKDVCLDHLKLHVHKELECDICNKKFTSEKCLNIHKGTHKEASFKCASCDAIFKTKCNLTRHRKTHQKKPPDNFIPSFTCQYCNKKVKLKSSLVRHINKIHPEHKNKPLEIEINEKIRNKDQEPLFSTATKNISFLNNSDLDLMTNSKDNIDSMNDADINELESDLQIQMIDNILLNTTKEMGIGLNDDFLELNDLGMNSCLVDNENRICSNVNVESTEVCLSMPDLMDTDQDITLGENAYILDNGNIVEPQKNSDNVVVYVLNEPKLNF